MRHPETLSARSDSEHGNAAEFSLGLAYSNTKEGPTMSPLQ
jgi:hypothetical protein